MVIKKIITSEMFDNVIELSEFLSKYGGLYDAMAKEGLGVPASLSNRTKIQNSEKGCQEALTHLNHLIPELEKFLQKYKTLQFEFLHLLEKWNFARETWDWTMQHYPEKDRISFAMFEKDRQEKIWAEHCREECLRSDKDEK